MNKKRKEFKRTINEIMKYIDLSPLLKNFFKRTKNHKFKFCDKLTCVLIILKSGISFRNTIYLSKFDMYWVQYKNYIKKHQKINYISDD